MTATGPARRAADDERSGVRVIRSDRLDPNTAQTPGMHRPAAVGACTGASELWVGTVSIEPDARTGAHHHGPRVVWVDPNHRS